MRIQKLRVFLFVCLFVLTFTPKKTNRHEIGICVKGLSTTSFLKIVIVSRIVYFAGIRQKFDYINIYCNRKFRKLLENFNI